jgi:hypothetical protein
VLHRGEHGWVILVTWAALILATIATSTGLWQEASSDGLWQFAGSCWIIAAMGWLLLPVLQRFTAAGVAPGASRVLASLDDVELVAVRARDGLDVRLAPGERLVLRRRA